MLPCWRWSVVETEATDGNGDSQLRLRQLVVVKLVIL